VLDLFFDPKREGDMFLQNLDWAVSRQNDIATMKTMFFCKISLPV
jgi:hypothetical protein